MATIRIKRGTGTPGFAALSVGEPAVNTSLNTLFIKTASAGNSTDVKLVGAEIEAQTAANGFNAINWGSASDSKLATQTAIETRFMPKAGGTFSGDITLGTTSEIIFSPRGGGAGSIILQAPSATTSNASYTFTLPVDDGSANDVLKTDGSGNLSWTAATSATTVTTNPDNTNITRYLVFSTSNQSGATLYVDDTAGAALTYNPSTGTLTTAGGLIAGAATIASGTGGTLTIGGSTSGSIESDATTVSLFSNKTNGQTINLANPGTQSGASTNINIATNPATGSTTTVAIGAVSRAGKTTTLNLSSDTVTLDSNSFSITGSTSINGSATISGNTTITGNLTVNGTTTTINTNTLTVDDKNIELGSVAVVTGLQATLATGTGNVTLTAGSTAGLLEGQSFSVTSGTGAFGTNAVIQSITNSTQLVMSVNHQTAGAVTFSSSGATNTSANGGGITLKGTTDKTIIWDSPNSNWTSSEDFNLATGKFYKINNAQITAGNLAPSTSVALGVGSIELGHATDTTLSRSNAGVLAVEGVDVVTVSAQQTLTFKSLTAPRITTGSHIADANGNELLVFPSAVASAVNEITVSNAATGSNPSITASGGDTNINLVLAGKGTGSVSVSTPLTVTGTLTANGAITANPSSQNISLSPTGTGTVTISPDSTLTLGKAGVTMNQLGNIAATGANQTINFSPTGTSSNITINPGTTNGGNINNMNIGATTRGTGAFSTLAANQAVTFTQGTGSTSTTTGTLVVTGGVGVSGAVFAGGAINATAGTASTSTTTGSLIVTGGVGVSGAVFAGGAINATATTASTSTTTGSLIVGGGAGVAGALWVGGGIQTSSTVISTISGTTQGSNALTNDINVVTATLTSGTNDAVTLPTGTAGRRLVVINRSATVALKVFPASTGQIDTLGTNAAYTVQPLEYAEFDATASGQWYASGTVDGGTY